MPFIPISFNNAFKTVVVVVGIETIVDLLRRAPADNAAGTAILRARRRNGVFVVIAARLPWQHALEVAEYDALTCPELE
jgi:hypothetical protein